MSTYNISVLCPTRGRPHRVEEFLACASSTASGPVEFAFYIDEDDLATQSKLKELARDNVSWFIGGKPKQLSACYNVLCFMSSAPIICYAADDMIFKSKGWDQIVVNEFKKYPDDVLLLYPADAPSVPIHGFVSRKSCETLEYFFPPYFEHGYADRWLMDIYEYLGRSKHCPSLKVDHKHWHADNKLFDEVYHERSIQVDAENRTCDDRDKIIYDAKIAERIADAVKLGRIMK